MDSSRRAVESYWRSRMIDGVTSDEDKVAPVYKLEEVCDLLRSSHVSIVKELSEFILKRLDHKSPVVKQKVLRLIKYSVGKSGVEFRREMQRHSAAIRQLFHYKGQLDPLKGDALNKAVRDTAHEALTAIFASEDSRPTSSEDINKRIQGFGNTNYEMPSEDKKSFLSEVVGLGSASIRQGFSNIASAHSLKKSDNGSYKSPNLRRSLTNEADVPERYEREEESRGTWGHLGSRNNVVGATYSQESRSSTSETENGGSVSHVMGKTREERLLESIVTSGGVRLQPTRDAIQAFLTEALKVDAMALCQALELKLQSPLWQVRMKAVCVLEAILRKKEDTHLSVIATYFTENPHAVVKCSETPQVTLREKANKVLALLDGEQTAAGGQQLNHKIEVIVTEMPDLIDTGDLDGDSAISKTDHTVGNTPNVARPLVDDLFGDSFTASTSSSGNKNEDDPFADVSFHTSDEREQRVDLLFSGLDVDSKQDRDHSVDDIFSSFIIDASQNTTAPVNSSNYKSEMIELAGPVNILQSSAEKKDLNDLMGGSAANASTPQLGLDGPSDQAAPTQVLSGGMNSKFVPANMLQPNPLFSLENSTQFNVPPGFMFNPAFTSLSQNYNALGSVYAQQQLLAAMSNFQHLGHMTAVQANNTVPGMRSSNGTEENSSPLPNIFHFANNLPQTPSSVPNSMKREETRAFDFISEHLSATRDSKRVS